jgi:hypothetical protein
VAENNEVIANALAEYVEANRPGGMVTHWVVVAEFIDGDGGEGWLFTGPRDQNLNTSLALIEFGRMDVKHAIKDYFKALHGEEND